VPEASSDINGADTVAINELLFVLRCNETIKCSTRNIVPKGKRQG